MDAGTFPKSKCTPCDPGSQNRDPRQPRFVLTVASIGLDGGENYDFSGFNCDFCGDGEDDVFFFEAGTFHFGPGMSRALDRELARGGRAINDNECFVLRAGKCRCKQIRIAGLDADPSLRAVDQCVSARVFRRESRRAD